jgi:5,6,7,8-tetrahydromethanopterin hydro-lyase
MNEFRTQVGEGFAGEGAHVAHVNSVLGAKGGPVEQAWASALASPSAGHVPFVVVLRPGLAVQPYTLFVNKAPLTGDEHARLTWGPAQAGVACGVGDALAEGVIDATAAPNLLLITAVWVDPAATDADAVFAANRTATNDALRRGASQEPLVHDVLAALGAPSNPFYTPPG